MDTGETQPNNHSICVDKPSTNIGFFLQNALALAIIKIVTFDLGPQVQLGNKGQVSNLWWMVPITVWLGLFLWLHTQYAVQCIFRVVWWCVGRHFSLGSSPVLFVCSTLLLGSSITGLLIAAPVLQRFLSEMCQDLSHNFSFVFKKQSNKPNQNKNSSFVHGSYQRRVPGSGRGMFDSARKQCVCVSIHIPGHTQEFLFCRNAQKLFFLPFFQIRARFRFFCLVQAGHSHKGLHC